MDGPAKTGSEGLAETSGSRASFSLWWFPVALGIYILGIGPAARIYQACPATRRALETIYVPLITLRRTCPPAGRVLDWYIIAVWKVGVN
jgi:hypothetical protein